MNLTLVISANIIYNYSFIQNKCFFLQLIIQFVNYALDVYLQFIRKKNIKINKI